MDDKPWTGHHCEVCYRQALAAKQHAPKKPENVQAAWNKTVSANKKSYEEAEARWEAAQKRELKEDKKHGGYVFAKSCALPDGVTDHSGFIPLELLKQYGSYAVLGASAAGGSALEWIGGSVSATALASRLGGTLAAVVPSSLTITVAALMPNTTSPDSAFYSSEQYANLTKGNTRARVTMKQLPDGSVDLYGFYTGGKSEWQSVPVIKAEPRGDQLVADFGDGIEITWTPAADPNEVLGIPALEGASLKPAAWVYPPGPKTEQILTNPAYPPDYQDAIIWFPNTEIQPIYISLSVQGDHHYHPKPGSIPAFPGLRWAKPKTTKKGGGLRDRWKDKDGTIYEWDSQHGALEKYNKRGKHLGEFDPITGLQTKPADKTREVEP